LMRPATGQDQRPRLDLVDGLRRTEAIDHHQALGHRRAGCFRDVVRPAGGQDEDHGCGGLEPPQIPLVAHLALAAGKHEPARLVRVPEVLALVVRPQRRREGLDQGGEPFPALGQTARRQVEALTAQVFQQPVGGPVKLILVEQDRHPERDTQRALGDPSGRRRWSDDARMHPTGAGGAIAAAADQAAMGLAVAGADGGVVGAREVRERLATVGAALLVGGQGHDFFGGGQVPMVAAAVSGVATLLAAWSAAAWRRRRLGGGVAGRGVAVPVRGRGRVGGQLLRAGTGFGATAEGLLAAETELGVAFGNRLAEDRRALARAGRHRLPVADWLAEGQALGLQGAGVPRGAVGARRGLVRPLEADLSVAAGDRQGWRGSTHAPVWAGRSCATRSVATVLPIAYGCLPRTPVRALLYAAPDLPGHPREDEAPVPQLRLAEEPHGGIPGALFALA